MKILLVYCEDTIKYFDNYVDQFNYLSKVFNVTKVSYTLKSKEIPLKYIDDDEVSIIISIQKIPIYDRFPDKKIILINPEMCYTHSIYKHLKSIYGVIDYSKINIRYYSKFANIKYHHFPVHYDKNNLINKTEKNIKHDVGFFPINTPRRKTLFDRLKNKGIDVIDCSGFGLEKCKKLNTIKILVNAHYYDNWNVLESIRVSEVLMNKTIVISEKSGDSIDDDPLYKHIIYAPYNKIVDKTIEVINNYDQIYNEIFSDLTDEKIMSLSNKYEHELVNYMIDANADYYKNHISIVISSNLQNKEYLGVLTKTIQNLRNYLPNSEIIIGFNKEGIPSVDGADLVFTHNQGIGYSRNHGIEIAKNNLILQLEDNWIIDNVNGPEFYKIISKAVTILSKDQKSIIRLDNGYKKYPLNYNTHNNFITYYSYNLPNQDDIDNHIHIYSVYPHLKLKKFAQEFKYLENIGPLEVESKYSQEWCKSKYNIYVIEEVFNAL